MALPPELEVQSDIFALIRGQLAERAKLERVGTKPDEIGRHVTDGEVGDVTAASFSFTTSGGHKYRVNITYEGKFQRVFVPVNHNVSVHKPGAWVDDEAPSAIPKGRPQ